jgi:hypothetical protein
MRCPQCGARNPLGSEECSSCGRPFIRGGRRRQNDSYDNDYPASEQTRQLPAQPAYQQQHQQQQERPDVHIHYEHDEYYEDEYYDEPYYAAPPPARRGINGCVLSLMVMLAATAGVIIGAILVTNLYVKPRVTDVISSHVGTSIENTVRERINVELANIPAGNITVSEAEINEQIAHQGNLGPVDNLRVSIDPGGVDAGLSAYGMSGNYSGEVLVENGQIRIVNGNLSGPLQYVVDEGEIEQIASGAINRALSDAGYRVEAVTLEDGRMILTLAQ